MAMDIKLFIPWYLGHRGVVGNQQMSSGERCRGMFRGGGRAGGGGGGGGRSAVGGRSREKMKKMNARNTSKKKK